MPGVSGLALSLTALRKTRRPSLRSKRAARPGEKPCGCVTASTTCAPRRSSSASRTSSGTSSQWTRTPRAGGPPLEKDAPPQLEVVVDAALDHVAHVVGRRHHEVLILRRLRREVAHLDRRVELDTPLARQRNHPERAEQRPERRDGEVRQAEPPGDR